MPKRKTAAKPGRASSSPKKARYRGSETRMAVGSPELRNLISRKPVVGISAQTGERIRFDSLLEAAEFLYAQGETSSVVAAQLIISQVCNGHRRTGFGYYWEFPHRGRPKTLETRQGKRGRQKTKKSRSDQKNLKKDFRGSLGTKRIKKTRKAISPNENGGETHFCVSAKGRKMPVTQKCQGYLRSKGDFW